MGKKSLITIVCLLLSVLGVSIAILVFTIELNNKLRNSENDSELSETVRINTEYGPIRGRRSITIFDKKPYYAFKGIPYAKPPLGELRFKPPQKTNPWTSVRDSYEFGKTCIQFSKQEGSEDCLFLNIYTPNVATDSKLPVLFAIHGGGFTEGSGNTLGPDFLFNEGNFVMVTFNYRLGPHGFLSLRTPEYSGNMGLKDQLLALKWTNDNIHNFGGDKNQITIYGISAGSVSAHMLILSPLCDGLFQRAILASGTANNPWAVTYSDHEPRLYTFAEESGHPASNLTELIEYLKIVDAQQLTMSTISGGLATGLGRIEIDTVWSPVIEPSETVDPFFDRSPSDILENDFASDVDTIFGVASDESYIFIDTEMRDPSTLANFDTIFEMQLPLYDTIPKINYESAEYKAMSNEIKDHYFGVNGVNEQTLYTFSVLVSDIGFNYGIDRSARLHAIGSSGKTFYYKFSVNATMNYVKMITYANNLGFLGATHADDTCYLFGTSDGEEDLLYNTVAAAGSLERKVIQDMTRMYVNFIIYGNPTPGRYPVYFEPVRHNTLNYLDISNGGLVHGADPHGENTKFWDRILMDYNYLPASK